MPKDMRGNEIKVGDAVFINGLQCMVKEVIDGGLLGAISPIGRQIQGMVIPGTLICEVNFNFETGKPVNCLVLKNPPESKVGDA